MLENQKIRPAQVIGPLGEPLTLDSLPPPSTTRWVVRRKAEVVAAVSGGLMSVDEACQRYTLIWRTSPAAARVASGSGCASRIKHYPISTALATLLMSAIKQECHGFAGCARPFNHSSHRPIDRSCCRNTQASRS